MLWEGFADQGTAVAQNTFSFVGRTIAMGKSLTWHPTEASALWQFHLHYHDWLADLYAAKNQEDAARLLEDWLLNCDHFHTVVWHPYPLSLRVVNWLTYGPWAIAHSNAVLQEAFYASLVRQVKHLQDNLERDLGGNHLIKNLKALIYAGLLVPGQQGLYLEILPLFLKELKRQVLPDGMHYELSPMYHVQVLQDVLDVHALLLKANQPVPPQLDDVLERMIVALAVMRHPDGGLALFNDGAVGDVRLLTRLEKRLGGVSQVPDKLPDAGYYRLQRGKLWLLIDAGRVGPDANPGHAHADMLSFELSIGAQRVFVNGGTYAYQHALRNTFRGTPMHTTVTVEETNSAEVWSAFRVGRRPRQVRAEMKYTAGKDIVWSGSHDGYRHEGIQHIRRLSMASDGSVLRGEDEINGPIKAKDRVMAHFHVHPEVQATVVSDTHAELTLPDGSRWVFQVTSGRLYDKESQYAPHFGELSPTKKLVIQGRLNRGQCMFGWRLKMA